MQLKGFIINQLPDGCWAYALTSSVLIIWKREVNLFWIFTAFMIAVLYEVLQSLHILNGTGDALDILTYFLSMLLALACNKSFKQKFINTAYTN